MKINETQLRSLVKKVIAEQSQNAPTEDGWYWIKLKRVNRPIPCWYMSDEDDPEDSCFIPGGLGDPSRNGIYLEDIEKIGPRIEQPEF